MYYLIKHGSKPYEVVCVHGGPGAAGEMTPVAKELSEIIGTLEPIQTRKTIEGQIKELKEIVEKYANIPITVVGFSWGAWLACLTAAKHPDLITKLILISSGPFEEKYVTKIHETRLSRLNNQEKKEFSQLIENFAKGPSNDTTSFERLTKLLRKTDSYKIVKDKVIIDNKVEFSRKIYRKIWVEATHLRKSGKLIDQIRRIKCPTIAIHGAYDPHPALGVSEPLKTNIKSFKFILLKDCGHIPWIEKYARNKFFDVLRTELKNDKYTFKS